MNNVYIMGRDSSVGIVTGYGLDGPGSNPGGGEIFRTRPDKRWGPTSLLYNGSRFFPGVKRPMRCFVHPPHKTPRLKKDYSYTSTRPLDLRGLL